MAAVPQFFGTSTSAFTQADKTAFGSPSWWRPPTADPIGQVLATAGQAAANVSAATQYAARALLLLLAAKPLPEITIEDTGEISFEWYRDNQHVAVLTVDGQNIRWAAMLDANTPVTGAQPFTKIVPVQALVAIDAAA